MPATKKLMSTLATSDLIQQVEESISSLRSIPLKKYDQIMVSDTKSNVMYYIKEGRVSISIEGPTGPQIITDRGESEFIGEMGLIQGQPRSATVTALEDCRLIVIPDVFVKELLRHTPPLCILLMDQLIDRLRATSKQAMLLRSIVKLLDDTMERPAEEPPIEWSVYEL